MNDTLIFLLLAGLAAVFKWLTSRGSSDAEKPEPPPPNESAPSPQTDQERVRRFLEALGVPPDSVPPPPVAPRPVAPRRVVTPSPRAAKKKKARKWEQPLPPLATAPLPPPPVVTETVAPPPIIAAPPLPREVTPPSLAAPVSRKPAGPQLQPLPSLREMLRARGSVRQAILLREILGPPRGIQPTGFSELLS